MGSNRPKRNPKAKQIERRGERTHTHTNQTKESPLYLGTSFTYRHTTVSFLSLSILLPWLFPTTVLFFRFISVVCWAQMSTNKEDPIDTPPNEPIARVSVVRQLEEEDDADEHLHEEVPLSNRSSVSAAAPTTKSKPTKSTGPVVKKKVATAAAAIEPIQSNVQPDAIDMDGTPGDDEPEPASVSPPASSVTATPKPASSKPTKSATPSKPSTATSKAASSKVASKTPSSTKSVSSASATPRVESATIAKESESKPPSSRGRPTPRTEKEPESKEETVSNVDDTPPAMKSESKKVGETKKSLASSSSKSALTKKAANANTNIVAPIATTSTAEPEQAIDTPIDSAPVATDDADPPAAEPPAAAATPTDSTSPVPQQIHAVILDKKRASTKIVSKEKTKSSVASTPAASTHSTPRVTGKTPAAAGSKRTSTHTTITPQQTNHEEEDDAGVDDVEDASPVQASPVTPPTPTPAPAPASATPKPSKPVKEKATAKKATTSSTNVSSAAPVVDPPTTVAAASSGPKLSDEFDFEQHSRLSSLTDEVRSLKDLLRQRDSENEQLADALLTLQSELETSERSSGITASKELARKNRDLSVLLTKERATHAQQLEQLKKTHAQELETFQATKAPSPKKPQMPYGFGSTMSSTNAIVNETPPPTQEMLEHKLSQVQKQYFERTNELSTLQSKYKSLQRILIKEIDENLKPEEVCEERFLGKWKGRAQRITRLQDKCKELERQLAAVSSGGSLTNGGGSIDPHSTLTTPIPSTAASAPADPHHTTLARMASDRKADLASVTSRLEERQREFDELRTKYIGLKARNKNLELEIKSQRDKLTTMFEKSSSDDSVIDSLQAHVSSLNLKMLEHAKEMKMRYGLDESTPLGIVRANAEARSNEQEKLIMSLREEVRQLKLKKVTKVEPTSEQTLQLSEYLRTESDTQICLLQVENTNLHQMFVQHQQRMKELEEQYVTSQKRLIELEANQQPSLPTTIAKQLRATAMSQSSMASSRSRSTAASTAAANTSGIVSASDAAQLRNQLQVALSESHLIQKNYAKTLESREQDIAILNEILDQKNKSQTTRTHTPQRSRGRREE